MVTSIHVKDPPACGWFVQVDSVSPEPRLDLWGIQLGEIAHHLRSTLNTTLTRIVEAEGGVVTRALQYPIAYSAAAWRAGIKRGQLRDVPERVVRAIYACQPFVWANASGTNPANSVLAVLAWLNNRDKHHLEIGGAFHGRWVEYEGRIVTPDGLSISMRPQMSFDWSLKVGSRLVDADTSPYLVSELGRTTLDMQIDILVSDELGHTTVLEKLLEEIWLGFQQAQVTMMAAWADESVDHDRFSGASAFKRGSGFGRAATDAENGEGTWEYDYARRQAANDGQAGSSALAELDLNALLDAEEPPTGRVDWAVLKGLSDTHSPPRTWRS